jgi:hypothetical protein
VVNRRVGPGLHLTSRDLHRYDPLVNPALPDNVLAEEPAWAAARAHVLAVGRAFLLAVLVAASAPARANDRQLLDEVVAVVEAHSITLSELAAETRVKMVEAQGPGVAEVVLDRKLLAASLRRVVEERVVLSEMERLKLFDLERSEVDNLLARLRARFPSVQRYEAFQRSIELTDDEIGAILARELRVARYLDNRLKLSAELRESELEEAARGQKLSRSDREQLRARLSQQKYLKLLAELLQELRKRADVRVLDPLDADVPADGGPRLGKAG